MPVIHLEVPFSEPQSCILHYSPFSGMPALQSHVHPKFVITALGQKLSDMRSTKNKQEDQQLADQQLSDLFSKTLILREILILYDAWTASIPPDSAKDKSYIGEVNEHSSNSSQHTKRSRVACPSFDEQSDGPFKRLLANPGETVGKGGLSTDAVSCWAQDVSNDLGRSG